MAYGIEIRIDVTGDRELFERVSKRHRTPREFMALVGVLIMGSAVRRLQTVLSNDADAVRTGRLGASLAVDTTGRGNPDSVFELGDASVTVGTNLRYAAQVQVGGRIHPVPPNKALAIPLIDQLRRSSIWPSELDPGRELLDFVPIRGGKSGNVIGLLIDTEGAFGAPGEALYAIARYVDQEPRPFLLVDDEDRRDIVDVYLDWLAA